MPVNVQNPFGVNTPQIVPDASSGGAGVVMPDNLTVKVTNGVLSVASYSGASVPLAISSAPDWPPAAPTAYDDEFTGNALNTGLWTHVINGAGNTIAVDQSHLTVDCPVHAGDDYTTILQPVPAGSWQVAAKVALAAVEANYFYAGMCVQDSAGKNVTIKKGTAAGTPGIGVDNWNSNTSYASNVFAGNSYVYEFYLSIKYDGVNLYFYWSKGGAAYHLLASVAATSFLADVSYIGLMAGSNGVAGVAEFDWFRGIA